MAAADDNLFDCNKPNLWIPYFLNAEADMASQWDIHIWPQISHFNFDRGVELSPGGGRNTKQLMAHAKELSLVDLNAYALTLCRFRFMDYTGPCKLSYHHCDGKSLGMIGDASQTFCYSWDSAVHFDREIVSSYVREFSRVLEPGGKAFLHHSNLGAKADNSIRKNPHWRSNVDAATVKEVAESAGMSVLNQTIFAWGSDADIDCISVFQKR